MRISDWSSDVCSSDLPTAHGLPSRSVTATTPGSYWHSTLRPASSVANGRWPTGRTRSHGRRTGTDSSSAPAATRSEEHTSELQSLMRISYAVFCLKKKKKIHENIHRNTIQCNNTAD